MQFADCRIVTVLTVFEASVKNAQKTDRTFKSAVKIFTVF